MKFRSTLKEIGEVNWQPIVDETTGWPKEDGWPAVQSALLRRIALAVEAMSQDRITLEQKLKLTEAARETTHHSLVAAERSNAALRGVITKLRKSRGER